MHAPRLLVFLLFLVSFPLAAWPQEIWFSPRGGRQQPADYLQLFAPDAPWQQAAAHVQVFEISQWMSAASPEAELKQIFADLRRRHIALCAGLLPLSAGPDGCGRGIEGYSAPGQSLHDAQRLKSLGAEVAYFGLDEPLYFGHEFKGRKDLVACHSSIADIAREVALKVKQVRTVYPEAKVGDVEPIMGFQGDDWLATIEQWLDAYQAAVGEPLAFFRLDMGWETPWQARMPPLAELLARKRVPLQVIYNGSGRDPSDEAWIAKAVEHFQQFESAGRPIPAAVCIQCWTPRPSRVLPETDPGALTYLVNRYVAWREARQAPNVLFILADDLGWRDTSLYGSSFYETPNIDRLAQRGMMFTQAYAAHSSCSPTRASIMTGLYPIRLGITAPACHQPEVLLEAMRRKKDTPDRKALQCESATRLKLEYGTLAERLKAAGYSTGHFGKWHLGLEPYDPLHRGFDVDIPHWSGPGPCYYVAPWSFPASMNFTGQPGEHIEDRMATEAIAFLRAHRDRPFYLNYWAFSVHSPYDGKPELVEKYRHKADPHSPQRNPLYAAMVESLDENVGRLLDALDELQLADRTIVVFFSDNGGVNWEGFKGERRKEFGVPPGTPITSNAPLRSGKGSIYEGGTREDCIVVWPGVVPPGSKSEAIVSSVDFFPTLLDMLRLAPNAGQKFDGVSIVPALEGRPLEREAIFSDLPRYVPTHQEAPASYVRQGDWKLIRFYCDNDDQTDRFELYNLRDDLGETKNLAAAMPEKVRQLDALIARHLRETEALTPVPNPNYRAALLGWRCNLEATLSLEAAGIRLSGRGANLQMATDDVPGVDRPVEFRVRMKSTGRGQGRVYWATRLEAAYHRDRSAAFDLQPDGQWHEYRVPLAVDARLIGLRFDPAPGPAEVTIEWIRLLDPQAAVERQWQFARPATAFHPRPSLDGMGDIP